MKYYQRFLLTAYVFFMVGFNVGNLGRLFGGEEFVYTWSTFFTVMFNTLIVPVLISFFAGKESEKNNQ